MKIESIFAMAESVAGSRSPANEAPRKSIARALMLATVVVFAVGAAASAEAQTFTSLYSFKGAPDGTNPAGGLAIDAKGNLYGTTEFGGAGRCTAGGQGCGTAFKLSGEKEVWVYSFKGAPDGAGPFLTNLVMDGKGSMYGATSYGGLSSAECTAQGYVGCGTIFKISPTGREAVLYPFKGGNDGNGPDGGLILDSEGNLYGTTATGGGPANCGTVFKVTLAGTESVLYRFCSKANGADGSGPVGQLARDRFGNLYGTTTLGGAYARGTVFKLAPNGEETVLYSFCALTDCTDGEVPYGGVVIDALGNLYGTTVDGGVLENGTVFKITPSGQETVLHSFAGGLDGSVPEGGLVRDAVGILYGTTSLGGENFEGTVFSLDTGGTESVLYSFLGGYEPVGAVIIDATGNLYGTTYYGGTRTKCSAPGCGTVFKVKP